MEIPSGLTFVISGGFPLLEHDEEILLGRQVQRLMEIEGEREEGESDDVLADRVFKIPVKQLKRELRAGKRAKDKMGYC